MDCINSGRWRGGLGQAFATLAFNRFLIFIACIAAVIGSSPSSKANFFTPDVDVMTVTDMKPDGKKFPVPTKEKPVYYEGIDAGYKDWGQAVAGDTLPNVKVMRAAVVRALARNHYLSADSAHAATEIIVMSWGTMYRGTGPTLGEPPALRFLAGDKYMDGEDSSEQGFMGFHSSGPRLIPVLSQSKLHSFANNNLYVALLRAYSTSEANNGRIVILWETRIACPSRGLALDQTLPTMVKLAAPNIGVEMKKEVFTTPEKSLKEDIQFGELTVLNDSDVERAHFTPIEELTKPEPTPTPRPESNESKAPASPKAKAASVP